MATSVYTALPSPDTTPTDTPLESSPSPVLRPDMRPSCKRKRTDDVPGLPITPPASIDDPESAALLDSAVNVLTTEAAALSHVSRLYQTDPNARSALLRAIEAIVTANEERGKLIVCGVGKSGYIGMKIVATMKSLGIGCSYLHAAEALHGDLGDVRDNDVVLFVSFSGKTAELLTVATHLPPSVTTMALTAHKDSNACPLLAGRQNTILLPAPILESEESSFGVQAPTTSTTVAIAVGDMLALSVAGQVHGERAGKIFKRNHPGGNIGVMARKG